MSRFLAIFLWFVFSLSYGGCSSKEAVDPVQPDESYAPVDPDKEALPADTVVQEPSKEVTDTTLDGKGDVIAPGTSQEPSSPASEMPPSEASQPVPQEPSSPPVDVLPPPPVEASVPLEDSSANVVQESPSKRGVTGSGKQRRYIKAWELNIRSEPNRFSKILGRLKGGDAVRVTIHGGWAKLEEGKWIRSRWLVKKKPSKFVGGPESSSTDSPSKKKIKKKKKTKKKR